MPSLADAITIEAKRIAEENRITNAAHEAGLHYLRRVLWLEQIENRYGENSDKARAMRSRCDVLYAEFMVAAVGTIYEQSKPVHLWNAKPKRKRKTRA